MKTDKKGKSYFMEFAGLTEYKNWVLSYANRENSFKKKTNESNFFTKWENIRYKFQGTDSLDEIRDLKSYIYPEKLQKIRSQVADKVKSLQVPDVRKKVQFKDRGEFSADRYFAGDTRKPFATMSKGRGSAIPTVNIYLAIGYDCSIKAHSQAPYNTIAGVIFADLLSKHGYAVNVYAVRSSKNSAQDRKKRLTCVTKIKDQNTYLDADTLAVLASDPRYFRYWGFAGTYAGWDIFGSYESEGVGYALNNREVESELAKFDKQPDFLFGQDFSEQQAVQSLQRAISQINQKYA